MASAASIAESARSSFERAERADEDVRVAAQRFARTGNGRGDREPVAQRIAQCRHFAVDVDAVLARACAAAGVVKTPLPGPEGVGADVE